MTTSSPISTDATRDRLNDWGRFLTVWLVVYCIFGWRLFVPRGPGEAVPIANALTAAILAGGVLLDGYFRREIIARARRLPWLVGFAGLWTLLSLAAPLVGYPVRTVAGAAIPLAVATFGLAVSMIWSDGIVSRTVRYNALLTIAWVQFAVGAAQALWHTGTLRLAPLGWLDQWDRMVMLAYGVEHYVGRSFGLYLNPNPYSLLGALMLVLALRLDLSRRQRVWLALPAAAIVFLGASRGVIAALALVAIPYVFDRLRKAGWRTALVAGSAAVLGTGLAHVLLRSISSELYARFLERWASLPALLLQGPSADPNAVGRLEAWGQALEFWRGRPLGTFGPPQVLVGTFMDNDFVALLVQGGVLLVLAYAGALCVGVRHRLESPVAPAIAPLIGLVVMAGITQNAVAFVPTIALLWSVIGTTGGRAADAARVRR
ncbi:MAG: hypothetical protein ACYC77_01600 [Coriobacteriia bacterium]